jgi:hypothetical protein
LGATGAQTSETDKDTSFEPDRKRRASSLDPLDFDAEKAVTGAGEGVESAVDS